MVLSLLNVMDLFIDLFLLPQIYPNFWYFMLFLAEILRGFLRPNCSFPGLPP